ncbi:hypothetical protein GCM10011273_03350 [Asticcacaulis endophyticus]|uniref:Uncharacterized protein n=1 Tax=Asticcacaulis endophyticus TaxID=1395890 RepID=A0A918PT03_9CAUL|nr:hypothetical protein GCM10011273_03350 [Asticcacaulis endophyticus]
MTKSQSSPTGVKFNHNTPVEQHGRVKFRPRASSYVDESDLEKSCAPEGYVAHGLAVRS